MLYNIQYVYEDNLKGERRLVGAKIFCYDGKEISVQEIYVGMKFTLEDIVENEVNSHAIGVNDIEFFKARYKNLNAAGIIYFPSLEKYEFLEEGDIVLPWVSEDLVANTLEEALQPYRINATDKVVSEKIAEKRAYIESLDPADSLVELSGLSMRKRISSR